MSEPGETKYGNVGASPVEIGRYTYGFSQLTIKEWGEGAALKIGAFCSIADRVMNVPDRNHRVY